MLNKDSIELVNIGINLILDNIFVMVSFEVYRTW